MNKLTKTALIAAMLLGGVSASAAQISIGVRIGAPPPPRVVRVARLRAEVKRVLRIDARSRRPSGHRTPPADQ